MKNAQIRAELKTKSRIQDIAADLASFMHANMFDDELREQYHNDEINLDAWLYENIEDGLAMLGGEGLIEKLEYDLILENTDDVLDDIVEQAEEFLIDEIELIEDEVMALKEKVE